MGLLQQVLEVLLRHLERLLGIDLVDGRKLTSGQRRQRKAAALCTQQQPFALEGNGDLRALGQRAADVEQLAARDRDFAIALHVDLRACDELDFEIGSRYRKLTVFRGEQYVGEYRHRLSAFHDPDHRLQRCKNHFALRNDLHLCYSNSCIYLYLYLNTVVSSTARTCAEPNFPERPCAITRGVTKLTTTISPVGGLWMKCGPAYKPNHPQLCNIIQSRFSTGSDSPRSSASASRAAP